MFVRHSSGKARREFIVVMYRIRPAAAACAALVMGAASQAATVNVNVFAFGFSTGPANNFPLLEPTINLGDSIHWVFLDSTHTTTSCGHQTESWSSPFLGTGQSFDHTFTHMGDFGYFCQLHGSDNGNGTGSGMASFVHVVPAPASLGVLGVAGLALARRRRCGLTV